MIHPVQYVNWVLNETNRWIKQVVMLQMALRIRILYSSCAVGVTLLNVGAHIIITYNLYIKLSKYTLIDAH